MFMRKDITDLNPNDLTEDNLHIIDDSILYMVNDLIFTSAGVMLRDPEVGVGKSGDTEWEHGDNVQW